MKAIMLMFDTLNRRFLPPYGGDWVHAPNSQRLAERTVVFDNAYAGSLPCMPARRELHTGRYNFLHRSWGPLEPFDDSMPQMLRQHGIHSHLVSDHYHYWEDGGATYHNRYSTWEVCRGQEGDPFVGDLNEPCVPNPHPDKAESYCRQDWINRVHIREEKDFPQAKTLRGGLDFIERNHEHDNWFLHIETFDPHQPFHVPDRYTALYDHDFSAIRDDWPWGKRLTEEDQPLTRHYRYLQAALTSMCDHTLGMVLDAMDRYGLWKDTMLIVNTDHGLLLGEHDWWGKCAMPFYNEVAGIPMFVWDPRSGKADERRSALVQTIDLAPTLLEFFGVERPKDMRGHSLAGAVSGDKQVREAGLFGIHGGHVNCTDGRYVYMRGPANPENSPLFNYTLMPTHMKGMFSLKSELPHAQLHPPFTFTKQCPVLKTPSSRSENRNPHTFGTMLFDLTGDPLQEHPIRDTEAERRMIAHLVRLMRENEAPEEQFQRLGL